MRTEVLHHQALQFERPAGRHTCQLWHRVEVQQQLPYTPRTFLFGPTLDSMVTVQECVRIADQHVHTAEVIPVKFASHLASNTVKRILEFDVETAGLRRALPVRSESGNP